MNSTTSPKIFTPGQLAYVPFWVLLEFLDATPPDPFVCGTILSINLRRVNSPTGQQQFMACDFEIKPDLVAPGIPIDYLIAQEDLNAWAEKIADWFKNYRGK